MKTGRLRASFAASFNLNPGRAQVQMPLPLSGNDGTILSRARAVVACAGMALMIRSGLAVFLIGAALGGCTSGYYASLADTRQQRASTAVPPSAQSPASRTTQAAVATGAVDTTGSLAQAAEIRPWPKRGTAEWNQLQREELDREERIKAALQSVCRAC